ncbi:YqeG family HAD IIIA-type phosphatase [Cohnella boryungensis]|uniref:YqeG family HAD IIIA-type phosphatase n=1 Tax=Cohnella boryungensis TaxID=768479 RepID=A0ABV8SD67_9BACL
MFKRLLPDQIVNTVFDIDLNELHSQGVRGIITDLDNTLVSAHTPLATPQLLGWLDLVKERGFQVVILSNNNKTRVSKFAEPLGIPYIPAAKKPAGGAFQRALRLMDIAPKQAVVVGDQMLTDIFGGRRAGLHTILVTPIAPSEEGWTTRMNRRIEKIALANLRKKGLWPLKGGDSHDHRSS